MSYAPPPEGQASSQPAGAAPQYSPDGRWYWDGRQWRPAGTPGPHWSRPYAPPESRAAAAVALVVVAVAGAALFFVGEGLDLIAVLVAPGSIVETVSVGFQLLAGLASIVGVVGAAISVPMWMHRAFRNLPALGATGLRWSPAWAAGAWFIPLANLVIPYLVARELWMRTSGAPVPPWSLLPVWWAAWVAANALQGASNSVSRVSRVGGDGLGILNDVGLVVAGALLILLIQGITRRQRERYAQLSTA